MSRLCHGGEINLSSWVDALISRFSGSGHCYLSNVAVSIRVQQLTPNAQGSFLKKRRAADDPRVDSGDEGSGAELVGTGRFELEAPSRRERAERSDGEARACCRNPERSEGSLINELLAPRRPSPAFSDAPLALRALSWAARRRQSRLLKNAADCGWLDYWSGRADLNCRPLAPQASALPG